MEEGWIKLWRKILDPKSKTRKLNSGQWKTFVCYILLACPRGRWRGYLVSDTGSPLSQTERAELIGFDRSIFVRYDQALKDAGLIEEKEGRIKVRNYSKYQSLGKSADGTVEVGTGSHLGIGSHAEVGTGSHEVGTGSHEVGTGSHEVGTGSHFTHDMKPHEHDENLENLENLENRERSPSVAPISGPAHQPFTDRFAELWAQKHGCPVKAFTKEGKGGVCAKGFSRLLAADEDEDEIHAAIDFYFTIEDPLYQNNGYNPTLFFAHYRGIKTRRKEGRRTVFPSRRNNGKGTEYRDYPEYTIPHQFTDEAGADAPAAE